MKPTVKIRVAGRTRYPGEASDSLIGMVSHHPKWPDEEWHGPIITSRIIEEIGDRVETNHTIYMMEPNDDEHGSDFPLDSLS